LGSNFCGGKDFSLEEFSGEILGGNFPRRGDFPPQLKI